MWQRVKDAGATVNVCPSSDSQYALGEGMSAFQKALDHGMRPGFSIDNEMSYGTDMFTEMRVAFNMQRAMATYRKVTRRRQSSRARQRPRRSWSARRLAARRARACSTNAGR